MYDSTHSLRFIPDTYSTVFGIGGSALCRGMKLRRWMKVSALRKPCLRYEN